MTYNDSIEIKKNCIFVFNLFLEELTTISVHVLRTYVGMLYVLALPFNIMYVCTIKHTHTHLYAQIII